MNPVVAPFAIDQLIIIFPEFQRRGHFLICKWPIAVLVVQISRSILQENTNGTDFFFSDERLIVVSSANICKAPDMTQNFTKCIWPFPSDGESTDTTRANSANPSQVRIVP